jgi:hypothetical protein
MSVKVNDYFVHFFLVNIIVILIISIIFPLELTKSISIWFLAYLMLALFEAPFYSLCYIIDIYNEFYRDVISFAVVLFLLLMYYMFMTKKIKLNILLFEKSSRMVLCLLLLVIVLMSSYYDYFIEMLSIDTRLFILLKSCGEFAICILLVVLLYFSNKSSEYKYLKEISEKYNEQQKLYFENLLAKDYETKKVRHDMLNHLIVIDNLNNNAKQNELHEYIIELMNHLGSNKLSTGDEIISVILNYYLEKLDINKKINIVVDINDYIDISDMDKCVLFSNLIKNSVEAINRSESAQKQFELSISGGEQFLNIYISNSYDGNIKYDKKGDLVTLKEDSSVHGIGMRNIRDVVLKYFGEMKTSSDKDIFTINIDFPKSK